MHGTITEVLMVFRLRLMTLGKLFQPIHDKAVTDGKRRRDKECTHTPKADPVTKPRLKLKNLAHRALDSEVLRPLLFRCPPPRSPAAKVTDIKVCQSSTQHRC